MKSLSSESGHHLIAVSSFSYKCYFRIFRFPVETDTNSKIRILAIGRSGFDSRIRWFGRRFDTHWPLIGTPFHHNPTPNNVCNSYNAGTSQKEVGKLEILFSSAEGGTAGKNIDHCLSYFVIDCQEEKGLEHAVHSWDEEGPEKAKS